MSNGPVPGWYPDPRGSGQLRWWDGVSWTEHVHPPAIVVPAQHAPGRLRPIGDWFSHIFRLLGDRAGHLFTIAAATLLPLWAVGYLLMAPALADVDMIVTDDEFEVIGWSSTSTWLMLGAVMCMALGAVAFLTAGQHQLWAAALDDPSPWNRSLRQGLAALPRLIGWSLVLAAGFIGAVVLASIPAAASPVLLLVTVPLLLVGLVWALVHLQFLAVTVVATSDNALVSAFSIARGRWWAVFGRTLLAMLVGAAASLAFAFVGQILSLLVGSDANAVVETSAGTVTYHWGELFPNVGAAIVLGIVAALQSGLSQAVSMAHQASVYVDAGGPSEPARAGDGDHSPIS